MYKLVLFDFDGTILDSDQMIVVTFKQLYGKYRPGYDPGLEHVLGFSGPPIRITLKNEFKDLDQDLMFDEFVKYSTINYDKYVKAFPYVKSAFRKLKNAGIKYGMITSKARGATNYALKLTGLDKYIEFSLCSDEVKNVKPDPEGIYKAMKYFGVSSKDEVLYVGDSIYDYETALNAGVKFGYVTFSTRKLPKNCKIDVKIDSFKEFMEAIGYEK